MVMEQNPGPDQPSKFWGGFLLAVLFIIVIVLIVVFLANL